MESKYAGYMGKVMLVDLTAETATEYPWNDEQRELYLGGKIMAARILCDHLTGKETAFSEENWMVISTGPLTGTGAPSSARFNISALSPQTGILASSNCGGSFGFHLKKAGYDALILKGKCNGRKWLEIHDDAFIFHDAGDLWGTKVGQCQEMLIRLIGKKKFGKLCIGPAGENLVKYAGIISDERAAGRTGLGAVLGWKGLKAITVSGSKTVPIYDKEKTTAWCKKWFAYLQSHPLTGKQLPRVGTAGLVSSMQMHGLLSTKNYSAGQYEDFEKVSGETLAEEYNIRNSGCLTCPIRCARTVSVKGQEVKGPELETLGLLGGNICNNDLQKILDWNYELDELGMDTISTANTIAWAMEANEKGLWDNGLEFGKTDNLSQVFEDIAHRRGIGDELAEGSKRLSQKYGGKEFAMHAKGLELAAYEPRRAVGQGLGYAVSNRGGCHLNGGYLVIMEGLGLNADSQTPKAKADLTMLFQDLMETISASGQCLFTSYAFFPGFLLTKPNGIITKTVNAAVPHVGWAVRFINKCPRVAALHLPVFHHTKMIRLATGMYMDFGKYISIGERGYTMERYINCKFGVSAANDKLPKRLTDVPQDPNNPKTKIPLETMKKTYYAARGWDQNGIPTEKTLRRLKIK
ncbi:MAG: aldehyde ferredoxin oxidoreductase family protein [Oscillospiraceae bacterium]|nr:aldehyde ferredoxin oxidoreductase family protein [Oscillospiraceae bacterium]